MYDMTMTKRVRDDKYFNKKDKLKEKEKMFGGYVEFIPVDMNGMAVTEGIGAANHNRNMKRIATDIQKRVGC